MADDVAEFIHENDLRKCVLIGHSMYVSRGFRMVALHTDSMAYRDCNNATRLLRIKGAPKPP